MLGFRCTIRAQYIGTACIHLSQSNHFYQMCDNFYPKEFLFTNGSSAWLLSYGNRLWYDMLHCRSYAISDTIHFRANRLATVETKSNQICPLDCKYLIKMDLVFNLQSFSACECNKDCRIEVPDIKCCEL